MSYYHLVNRQCSAASHPRLGARLGFWCYLLITTLAPNLCAVNGQRKFLLIQLAEEMEAAAFGLEFTCVMPSCWDRVGKTAWPHPLLYGLHCSLVLSYNVKMLLMSFKLASVEGGGFDTKPLKLVLQLFCNFSVL